MRHCRWKGVGKTVFTAKKTVSYNDSATLASFRRKGGGTKPWTCYTLTSSSLYSTILMSDSNIDATLCQSRGTRTARKLPVRWTDKHMGKCHQNTGFPLSWGELKQTEQSLLSIICKYSSVHPMFHYLLKTPQNAPNTLHWCAVEDEVLQTAFSHYFLFPTTKISNIFHCIFFCEFLFRF